MMRPRTPILAILTAFLALGAPAWPLAAGMAREARGVPQQVQDGQRLVIDTLSRVSPHVLARQSGRYENAAQLSHSRRAKVVETVCGSCVRCPVWEIAPCGL